MLHCSLLSYIQITATNTLIGTLPPEIQHLTYLKRFHAAGNEFLVGSVPSQYGRLRNLNDREL